MNLTKPISTKEIFERIKNGVRRQKQYSSSEEVLGAVRKKYLQFEEAIIREGISSRVGLLLFYFASLLVEIIIQCWGKEKQ